MIRRPDPTLDGPTTLTPRAARAGRSRGVILALAAVLLFVPLAVGVTSSPPAARGDDLADAVASQKALAARIAAQKVQVAKLNALQVNLKGEIADTNAALMGINADLGAVKTRIGKLGKDIAAVKATYQDLVVQLAELDAQLVTIQGQEAQKASDLAARKAILAGRLRAAYATDRTSLLETVLSSDSFAQVLSDVGYLMDFGAQDQALAAQIVHDQQTLATLQQSVTDTRVATDGLRVETAHQRADIASRIADLKAAQAQLKQLQAETARQLAIQRANFAKLERNRTALANGIKLDLAAQTQLKSKIADILARQRQLGNIPSEYNGSLAWPMVGTVTQEFGCTGFAMEPQVGDCAHFHQGIDIVAPMYTPVRAAGDGTVLFAGPNPYDPYPKAWIVIIAHSEHLQTWYAHLDDVTQPPTVRPGDAVHQGDVVGYEGTTGRSTGPHLHWMVELDGNFVNPRLFV